MNASNTCDPIDLLTKMAMGWVTDGCAREKVDAHPGLRGTGGHDVSSSCRQDCVQVKTHRLLLSGAFHLIFSDCGWLKVTVERGICDKGPWGQRWCFEPRGTGTPRAQGGNGGGQRAPEARSGAWCLPCEQWDIRCGVRRWEREAVVRGILYKESPCAPPCRSTRLESRLIRKLLEERHLG